MPTNAAVVRLSRQRTEERENANELTTNKASGIDEKFSLNGSLILCKTKAVQRELSCGLTKEVNRPNRRPAKGKRREIEAHVEGNQIVAVGSELNDRLGSGARLRKAGADECSGDAAFTAKNRRT